MLARINTFVAYILLFNAQSKFIPPKQVETREPEDEQLCKLSAPYREIKHIQNP